MEILKTFHLQVNHNKDHMNIYFKGIQFKIHDYMFYISYKNVVSPRTLKNVHYFEIYLKFKKTLKS